MYDNDTWITAENIAIPYNDFLSSDCYRKMAEIAKANRLEFNIGENKLSNKSGFWISCGGDGGSVLLEPFESWAASSGIYVSFMVENAMGDYLVTLGKRTKPLIEEDKYLRAQSSKNHLAAPSSGRAAYA